VNNSIKLPVAALSIAVLFAVFTFGSIVARTTERPGGPSPEQALAARGGTLYNQLGCQACHSLQGAAGAGPALNGVYGRVAVLENGEEVISDDAYLREAILNPNAKIVKGYQANVMAGGIQGVLGQLNSGDTTDALIAFLKSVSPAANATPGTNGTPGTGGTVTPRVGPSATATR
jgi:cytochrome c oxidase subunit 2